jgi:hypothetical protein
MSDFITYTIQPTDSIRGIAERFGVPLDELVKLNPQVCTNGKQEGIEIKIHLIGNCRNLYFRVLELYGFQANEAFTMLCKIAESYHYPKMTLSESLGNAAEYMKQGSLFNAFEIIGLTKNPASIYRDFTEREIDIRQIPEIDKRLAEFKEIKTVYDSLTA